MQKDLPSGLQERREKLRLRCFAVERILVVGHYAHHFTPGFGVFTAQAHNLPQRISVREKEPRKGLVDNGHLGRTLTV